MTLCIYTCSSCKEFCFAVRGEHVHALSMHVCILKEASSEMLDIGHIKMCSECNIHVDLIIPDVPVFNFREDSK